MPIAWTNVQDAIKSWVVARSGTTNVVWSNQRAPQPPYPYLSLVLGPPRKVQGIDGVITTENDLLTGGEMSQVVLGQREVTLTIDAFSDKTTGEGTAMQYLETALTALALPGQVTALRQAGLSLVDYDTPTDLTGLESGTFFVSRAHTTVRFYLLSTLVERDGYIAEAEVTPTLDGVTGAPIDFSVT